MNRPILTCAFLAFASTALVAQQSTQPDPYQGQSHPPADVIDVAPPLPQPKPPAGTPMVTPAPAPPPLVSRPAPVVQSPAPTTADDMTGNDDGIVQVAPADGASAPQDPTLQMRREYASDPDGDIVHPYPAGPNTLPAGTMIRARLLTLLSTSASQRGDEFRARVASDVLQDGNVLIPTGAEIAGRVVEVSEGHPGGHGSIRLRPDTVILADGSRYRMDAQVEGAPGTNTSVTGEGVINAGSRWKKDGVEYSGGVGAGAVTGAMVAGPIGAATGSLIGAGLITVHLLTAHPQAVLPTGTVLIFTLNSHLSLTPTPPQGN